MFSSPFRDPFQNPFTTEGAAAEDWWLSGGISAGDCVAAYQAKGAASLAASYSNLNDPGTNDAAPGVAPTWDNASGWVFNGLTQYLTNGFIPSDDGISVLVRFDNGNAAAVRALTGFGYSTVKRINLRPVQSGLITRAYYNAGVSSPGANLASGVMAIVGKQPYLNDSTDGGLISGNNTDWAELYIGALNSPAGASLFFSGNIKSYSIYNAILSAPQVLAVTNAMNAL